uniref:Alcohol dehydrogenase 1 n=1 Tax=Ganoderma boninense TaxID=34458 RepID=A0A5K1JXY9_9APHY|nr:Alcohol dehydrogenase 1 [Ganoderma boninense]
MRSFFALACSLLAVGSLPRVMAAFNMSNNNNLAVYWGQDGANGQQPLAHYCQDDTIDTIPLAFLYKFSAEGGMPVIDFANTCSSSGNSVFKGTSLAKCDDIGTDIKTCQQAGKIVTLSLGGATGLVGFTSDAQAETFADTIWNLFLGGESAVRPFGRLLILLLLGFGVVPSVLRVDLDIESGSPAHYAAFVNRIRANAGESTSGAAKAKTRRSLSRMVKRKAKHGPSPSKNSTTTTDPTSKNKKYYITAAPQCPYPDANIGAALNEAPFDAVYVQFCTSSILSYAFTINSAFVLSSYPTFLRATDNNYCGLNYKSEFNFATWDKWAKTQSANPDVKVYIGAPASPDAAGEGYVSPSTLAKYVADAQKKYSSFGGVMLWDADSAYNNDRFDKAAKNALMASSN